MQIRRATEADRLAIAAFQIKMAMESEEISLDPTIVERGVERIFREPRWGHYYVAEGANGLMGSVLIQYEWSDWRNAVVWWIHSVYVIPSQRRQGVFTRLFETIQKEALDASVKGLRLYVEKENSMAKSCYQNLGMTSQRYDLYEKMLSGR
jgi:GNAT superfamily N-acetyltransferase